MVDFLDLRFAHAKVVAALDTRTKARLRTCNKQCLEIVGDVHPDHHLVIVHNTSHLGPDFEYYAEDANTASYLITCESVRRRFPLITVLVNSTNSGDTLEPSQALVDIIRFGGSYGVDGDHPAALETACVALRNGCTLRVCTPEAFEADYLTSKPANQSVVFFSCNLAHLFLKQYCFSERLQAAIFARFIPASGRPEEAGEREFGRVNPPWFWNGDNNQGGWKYPEEAFVFDVSNEHEDPGWVGDSDAPAAWKVLSVW